MTTKEMRRALEADGAKLKATTGRDHGPHFDCEHDFQPDPKCWLVDICTKCGDERA